MIENFKDLEKLLKLCRKQGVTEIDLHGVKLKLGDLPNDESRSASISDQEDPLKNFPQGVLTDEQLMFYSAGGVPENDPELAQG